VARLLFLLKAKVLVKRVFYATKALRGFSRARFFAYSHGYAWQASLFRQKLFIKTPFKRR
jgi:hypothetical protein